MADGREQIYLGQRFSDHAPVIIDYDFKLLMHQCLTPRRGLILIGRRTMLEFKLAAAQ